MDNDDWVFGCKETRIYKNTRVCDQGDNLSGLISFPGFSIMEFFSWFQHFKYVCRLKGTVGVILNDLPDVESQSGVSNVQQYPLSLCLIKYNRLIISFL